MNILYETKATGTIDDVGERLEKAAQNHQFGVLNVIDLKAKMKSKGIEFGPEFRIYEVCNPQRAKQVLEENMGIATALPCRIALYQSDNQIGLSTMRPPLGTWTVEAMSRRLCTIQGTRRGRRVYE